MSDARQPADVLAPFRLDGPLPQGRLVIEASAGTGKTYSLTALVVRHLVEAAVRVDQLLVVTFTRAAAAELRERTRAALVQADAALADGAAPADTPWLAALVDVAPAARVVRRQRVQRALARYDEATITTIHGFCQQALAQLGLRSGLHGEPELTDSVDEVVREVCRDLLVEALADDPDYLGGDGADRLEGLVVRTVKARLSGPHVDVVPPAGIDPMADRWLQLGSRAVDEVRARQQRRRQLSFDGLVRAVRDAVADPVGGAAVCAQLSDRYRVVLVDEFQDTDPYQWEIFETAFAGSTLVTVGDPKQAIYRFRGADVHAYLAATAGRPTVALDVNHRSDPEVLDGLEVLLRGATLGHPRILVTPVQAARPPRRAAGAPAVQLRVVPNQRELFNKLGQALAVPAVRRIVLADLATRVVELLGQHRPGDIAVLVPSHADARAVADVLRLAGVPSTRTRTGPVLAGEAVRQWQLLLAALAAPGQAAVVRAAGMGWALTVPVAELAAADSAALARLQELCATLAGVMSRRGVMAAFDQLMAQPGVLANVLSHPDGQRRATDLAHIAELLAARTHGSVTEPLLVQRALHELCSADSAGADEAMRRIDTDAPAVQISTIHGAKGLEFPVVLLPFSFKSRPDASTPRSYVLPDDPAGVRHLDGAPGMEWAWKQFNHDTRTKLMQQDIDGDSLRLLYVALTRAVHRVEVWWANGFRWRSSPLARVLFDREGAGPIANSGGDLRLKRTGIYDVVPTAFSKLGLDESHEQIRRLVDDSNGSIGWQPVPVDGTVRVWADGDRNEPADLDAEAFSVASARGRLSVDDRGWRSWSFTSIAGRIEHPAAMAPETRGGDDEGGGNEPAGVALAPAAGGAARAATPLRSDVLASSATLGTLVHSVLEQFDPSVQPLHEHLLHLAQHHITRSASPVDPHVLAGWLVDVVHSPLGPSFGGATLAQLPAAHRLAEARFDLPLAHLDAASLAATALGHLPGDDPMAPALAEAATQLTDVPLAGWLTGSIDGLFRVHGARGAGQSDSGDTGFIVVDYKTNRLHGEHSADAAAAYHPDALPAAMAAHHYELQALLYLVATHRFLGWRMGTRYRAEQHLRGAAYLFVRGMTGERTPLHGEHPYGVCVWRPPTSMVLAVDALVRGQT
jgi:exodeoxyribonuclease V beta subunit